MVGVLVLIHQHVAKPCLIFRGHVRESAEKIDRLTDQVIKIESLRSGELSLIAIPNFEEKCVSGIGRVRSAAIGVNIGEFVFQPRHFPDDRTGRESGISRIQFFQDSLHQCALVSRVINRERAGISKTVVFFAQDSNTRRVKGGNPHPAGGFSD